MLKPGAADAIYKARERQGLSRADLEQKTVEAGYRISAAAIYNLEKGKTPKPYLRTIYTLADVLGLEAKDLCSEDVA